MNTDRNKFMLELITNIDDLDINLINDVLKIDSMVYPEHIQGTFDEVYDRFKANRDMLVLLCDGNKLIGYLCLFPIKEELYDEIVNSDRMFDSDIPGELLEQYEPYNTYTLYIISIAILPEYHGKGLSNRLIEGFHKYIFEKKKNNIYFSAALSTAVTEGGEYILKKMGFKKRKILSEGYVLYELLIDDDYYN